MQQVLGYLSGSEKLPNGINLIQLYAKAGLVPLCAMNVTRDGDGSPLRVPTPAEKPKQPCGCYFDALTSGSSSSKSGTTPADCDPEHPTCSYGYCER